MLQIAAFIVPGFTDKFYPSSAILHSRFLIRIRIRVLSQPEIVKPKNVKPKNVKSKNVKLKNVIIKKNVKPKNVKPKNVKPKNVKPENVNIKECKTKNVKVKCCFRCVASGLLYEEISMRGYMSF